MTTQGEEKAGDLKLYTYWRSSAAYRVRIGLNLKKLRHELIPVHLVRDGGEQHRADYRKLSPQGLVPTLMDGERVIRQSLTILEYLEEVYPEAALLPYDPRSRSRVRALAQIIACDTHPLNNLRVLQFLEKEMGVGDARRKAWYHYWMEQGLSAVEQLLAGNPSTGTYCEGDEPGLADLCLVPQVYNALRYELDLKPFPTINRVYAACMELSAFQEAAPENQPDAQVGAAAQAVTA